METEMNALMILAVYEKIITHGKEVKGELDGMKQLEGINAYSDFDGYTVYLEDSEVHIQTGFHNTYKVDYESSRAYDNFVRKMKYIKEHYD